MRRVEIREKLLCTVLRTVGVKYAGGPSKDLVVSKLQEWRASMDTVECVLRSRGTLRIDFEDPWDSATCSRNKGLPVGELLLKRRVSMVTRVSIDEVWTRVCRK